MVVEYDRPNDTYFIKEKIDNQTYRMDFTVYDETYETVYVNIALYVYTKRKTIERDMENKNITGHNPTATVSFSRKAFKQLEDWVMSTFHYKNIIFIVVGTDIRRFDIYKRFLSRYGYTVGFNRCLIKKIIPTNNPYHLTF